MVQIMVASPTGLSSRLSSPRQIRSARPSLQRSNRLVRTDHLSLKADVSEAGEVGATAGSLATNPSTVRRSRKQLAEEGPDAALSSKAGEPAGAKVFEGAADARRIALTCSQPPDGHIRWNLCLLESKVVELGAVERPATKA